MVLGKGLGALITSAPQQEQEVTVVASNETLDDGQSTDILAHVEVANIDPNPYQPRIDFEPEALQELAQSIREKGLVQPVTVRRWEGGYQLISGERRLRACKLAGITHIPAYIRQVDSAEEMIELALIENIQRATLNPVEIAQSYRQLVEDYQHTPEEIARRVGKDRSTVVNFIRLLKLPKRILDSVQRGELSMGHARALLSLPDEQAQLRIWQRIVRENLSVRKVEELAKSIYTVQRTVPAPKPRSTAAGAVQLEELSRKLRPIYGTKVNISTGKDGKGSISFEFYSHDDLERLLELFLKD